MTNLKTKLNTICIGSVMALTTLPVLADFVINDDLVVDGSICAGFDCVNGESFGFDTLRLKENNLRIRFVDTSNSASFPSNDWQITANDTTNGGANKFSIDDIDGGRTPFTIEAGAPSHSLYVEDSGQIGLGTSTPVVELHMKDGDTPTIRLEQDGSSGFTQQIWDVAANETNFFIRDVTNGSKLPFRIRPGAPTSSIDIAADGDVGMGLQSPEAALHVRRSNGEAKVFIEETNGTKLDRDLLHLKNNGNPQILLENTENSETWRLSAGEKFLTRNSNNEIISSLTPEGTLTINAIDVDAPGTRNALVLTNNGNPQVRFRNTNDGSNWRLSSGTNFVFKNNLSTPVFTISQDGNVQIPGSITTGGNTCGGKGCDLTFKEGADISSIEDHAAAMWQDSHLPAVGPTTENQPINLSEKTGGMLHELEVAHIYIEQLHKRINEKDNMLQSVIKRLEAIERSLID